MISTNISFPLQIVLSIVLIALVLLQVKGTGFGRVWGSGDSSFARRGLEKLVFKFTFVIAILFMVVSVLNLVRL